MNTNHRIDADRLLRLREEAPFDSLSVRLRDAGYVTVGDLLSAAADRNEYDEVAEAIADDDFDPGPHVCPGCYVIGDAPCASWCPDAAIERRRQEEIEREDEDECITE